MSNDESLYDFLVRNKDKIEYVHLEWTWPELKLVQSKYVCMDWDMKYKEFFPRDVYLCFGVDRLDQEYSFMGTIEEAMEFASSYDCWDGHDFDESTTINEGIFELAYQGYNPDEHYHPDEIDPNDLTMMNIRSLGYYIYKSDGDNVKSWTKYDGPIVEFDYDNYEIKRIVELSKGTTDYEQDYCKTCIHYKQCSEDNNPRMKDKNGLYKPSCPCFEKRDKGHDYLNFPIKWK